MPAGEIGYFLDTQHGWLLTPSGGSSPQRWGVSRTDDGGRTWAQVGDVESPQVVGDATLAFSDPQTGWLVQGVHAAPGHTGLLVTHDGGHTWNEVTVPVSAVGVTWQTAAEPPSLIGGSGALVLLAHSDQTTASAARSASSVTDQPDMFNTVLLSTTADGGRTWSQPTSPAPLASGGLSSADFFLDGSHWWMSVVTGNLMVTADGGATWKTFATPHLSDLQFVDARQGWAVAVPARRGEPDRLLHTTDGGATWTRASKPPDPVAVPSAP